MLDLIVLSSAVAITKYIGQRNPLLPADRADAHWATRYIFHATLLNSLLLFGLSALEAAPVSWLVVIVDHHRASSSSAAAAAAAFVRWYRVLLWSQCIMLLFVHPLLIGAVAGASLCTTTAAAAAGKKLPPAAAVGSGGKTAPTMPPSSPGGRNVHAGGGKMSGRGRPLILLLKIVWISIRFAIVTVLGICWSLVRRVVGAIIPYRITRRDRGRQCCSTSIVLTVLISLSSSFVVLTTVGSLIIRFDHGTVTEGRASPQETSLFDCISLKFMVSVVCALGMIVASLLNGFGCASLPHSNLVGLFLKPTPNPVIAKVEEDFHYATKQLEDKRWMMVDALQQQSSTSHTPSKNKSSSEAKRVKQLQQEVLFLENLVGDMSDDIGEMKQSHRLALAARTPFGRIRGFLGVVFSIVLVVRVILAAKSFMAIFEGGSTGGKSSTSSSELDPLTSVSLWLLGRNYVSADQYDLFRQGTSLVLAGALSASQVRAFFRVVGALGRRLSGLCYSASSIPMACARARNNGPGGRGAGRRTDLALLLSSFVMGCYFLACVAVVKMTLPMEYRSSFTAAVGLNFRLNTRLLNMIFFGSACISAATLGALFGIQRNNSKRYVLESQLSSASLQLV